MKLIFWQNMVSSHTSSTVRELALQGHDVLFVADKAVSEDRRMLGLAQPDLSPARLVLSPTSETVRELVGRGDANAIQVVGGFRGASCSRQVINACSRTGARLLLMAEGGDPRGLQGIARRLLYSKYRLAVGTAVDAVLAMGENGVRWYRSCGWPESRVFPYAYTTETPAAETHGRSASPDGVVRLTFVGNLVHRKGLDILFTALRRLRSVNWQLSVVGDGAYRSRVRSMAVQGSLAGRIHSLGVLQNERAGSEIAGSDLLILPSRFDGWGAVVNEALSRGVPVLCSDRCGAADLIRSDLCGRVFPGGSVAALAEALEAWIARGPTTTSHRSALRSWSACISGRAVSGYLTALLTHLYDGGRKPLPPWHESRLSGAEELRRPGADGARRQSLHLPA